MNIDSHAHNMKNYGNDLTSNDQAEGLLKAMRMILLAPIFIYLVLPYQVYLLYYAFCFVLPLAALFFGVGRDAKIDPFILWLITWFLIACTLDLINGSQQITYTVTLGYSISVLLMITVFKVRFREMAFMVIIGAGIYYGHNIYYKIYHPEFKLTDHGRAVAISIISLVLIVRKQYKWGFLSLVLFSPLIGRNAWLALFVSLFPWFVFRSVRNSASKRRILLVAVLIIVIAVPMLIGIFFGDSLAMFYFTTQRSLFYSVMVDEAYSRGLDILLPVSNHNARDVLSEHLREGIFTEFGKDTGKVERYYRKFQNPLAYQVPHSAYLEMLVNYGLVIMVVMLVWLAMLGNSRTWPLIVHFMVAIMTDSEYFIPVWIVPYVIAYRELYFHNDQGNVRAYQTVSR